MNIPIWLMQQESLRFINNRLEEPMKDYQSPEEIKNDLIRRTEINNQIQYLPSRNMLDSSVTSIKAKPILVVYLDVREISPNQLDKHCAKIEYNLESIFGKNGWLVLLVPITDGRSSYVESHVINKLQEQEFENFKEQVLQKIKGE